MVEGECLQIMEETLKEFEEREGRILIEEVRVRLYL